MLTKQIEATQKRIEGRNYSIRKSVLQYDDVMNKQRELIYGQRRDILMGHDVRQNIIDMVHKLIDSTAERNFTGEGSFDWSIDDARDYLEKLCLKPGTFDRHADAIKTMDAVSYTHLCGRPFQEGSAGSSLASCLFTPLALSLIHI